MLFREIINGTTAGDRILFVLLLVVSFCGMAGVRALISNSGEVTIEVAGVTTHRYDLSVDRTAEVESRWGRLTVEIKDRKVRVVNASCDNRLCEKQGWVSAGGIICLPNRIVVVIGGPGKRRLDAVTG